MKFGRKVHYEDSVIEKVIGSYTCPLCGEDGKLLDRRGAGFRLFAVECRHGHRHTLAKQIYKKYDVGMWCVSMKARLAKILSFV